MLLQDVTGLSSSKSLIIFGIPELSLPIVSAYVPSSNNGNMGFFTH